MNLIFDISKNNLIDTFNKNIIALDKHNNLYLRKKIFNEQNKLS